MGTRALELARKKREDGINAQAAKVKELNEAHERAQETYDSKRVNRPRQKSEGCERHGRHSAAGRSAVARAKHSGETLTYMAFPREHWSRIRTNNMLERVMREIRRRTRVVGNFPDGKSALMLVGARLRHIAGTRWGTRPYMDMTRLTEQEAEASLSPTLA